MAGLFFSCAPRVKADQMRQQGVGIEAGRQAIGLQYGGIEFVMQFLQHADQALGVDGFFLERQNPFVLSLSKDFKHVVHARQREAGMRRLLALAVFIDLLGQLCDAFAQAGREAGVFVGGKGTVSKQRDLLYRGRSSNVPPCAKAQTTCTALDSTPR